MDLLDRIEVKPRDLSDFGLALAKRSAYLSAADQTLLKLVLRGAVSRRSMALVLGKTPGTITRKLRRLMNRLHDKRVVRLIDEGQLLPEHCREIGLRSMLRGETIATIGREMKLAPWRVKVLRRYVSEWLKTPRS